MPERARIVRIAWLVCLVAACGRQPSSPGGAGAPGSGPASGSPAVHDAPRTVPSPPAECDPAECGPAMRMPSRRCPDGSIGGPTGRCLRHPDGRCGWEVRACP